MHVSRPVGPHARLLVPLALAAAGVALLSGFPAGPAAGDAGDRYRAGERATVRTVLPAAVATGITRRGLAHARALGVPSGTATSVTRVTDRFSGTVVDEVVTTDLRGRRLGIVRMDGAGRLASAVRLGWRATAARHIDAATARALGVAIADRSGIRGAGTPTVAAAAEGGWRVAWQRRVDGVPVAGDGSIVTLFGDGTFHAAVHRERPLAAAPGTTLPAEAARRIARERLGALLRTASDQARIVGSHLAWVAPNDTFNAAAPDAPDPVLRLAWVVEVRTVAPLAGQLRALELYLDAGDGSLVGGDLLR
jgi:hypothetical protein